jgi:hypothetical protein
MSCRRLLLVVCALLLPVRPSAAQDADRTIVRAIRLSVPIRIDGVLDEIVYTSSAPVSDFIQQEPR